MKYRFYLNNTLVTEPRGWSDMVTSIKRDRVLKGMLVSQDATVEFTNEPDITDTLASQTETGYNFLRGIYDSEAWTGEIDVKILVSYNNGHDYTEFYKGIIFLADIEWDLFQRRAKVKIRDNSYDARLNNNKSIKVYPSGGKSKNNVTITAPSIGQMTWFRPGSGATIQDDDPKDAIVYCYRLGDVLEYVISYCSDGEIDFASTEFDTGGEFENLLITTGRAFRKSVLSAFTDTTDDFVTKFPGISLEQLLTNITRIADFNFIIESTGGRPTFRLERESYFRQNGIVMECENVDSIKEFTDVSQLYSKVKLGSNLTHDSDGSYLSFIEETRLVGFNKEEYPILGTSNIDNTLDLSLTFTTSSNVIEYIYENAIVNDEDDKDKEFFLITATEDSANVYTPTESNWINANASTVYYNENLTNDKILSRHLGGIPNTITSQITSDDNTFSAYIRDNSIDDSPAYRDLVPVSVSVIRFGGETSDPGNNYDNTSTLVTTRCYYTAPANGVYSFKLFLDCFYEVTTLDLFTPYDQLAYTVGLKKYDSGGVLIQDYDLTNTAGGNGLTGPSLVQINQTKAFQLQRIANISMQTGERVSAYVAFANYVTQYNGYEFVTVKHTTSTFECTADSNAGGNFAEFNPSDYRPVRYEFDYPINYGEWIDIKTNPRSIIKANLYGENSISGYIESIKMNHAKGTANIVLNANKKIT